MGRYPAPVVAAIGCGDQPAGPPVFAAFFGEFHCIPLKKGKHSLISLVLITFKQLVLKYNWQFTATVTAISISARFTKL